MIDLQKAYHLASQMATDTRSKYHLTLGRLIRRLEKMPRSQTILTCNNGFGIEGLCSYRGYYSDLALCPTAGAVLSAGQLLGACNEVLDTELTGYKGGEFLMTKDTPLWVAEYGRLGVAVTDITPDGLLITRNLDEEED